MRLILILSSLLLFSCGSEQEKIFLPSIGEIDELLIVAQDQLWKGDVGKHLRSTFQQSYPVLPQPESSFKLRHRNYGQFKNKLLKRLSTIILLSTLDKPRNAFATFFNEEEYNKLAERKQGYLALKNRWAKPQLVVLVFARNEAELLSLLQKDQDNIMDLIYDSEAGRLQTKLKLAGSNRKLEKRLKEHLGIQMFVPGDYVLSIGNDTMAWFRKDDVDQSINILIHIGPLVTEDPVTYRNKILKRLISSEIQGSFIKTDTLVYKLMTTTVELGGRPATLTKGLWRMQQDFMGGPFVNYLLRDEKRDRLVMIEGFVYAPKLKKRPLMRQVAHLLNNISFD